MSASASATNFDERTKALVIEQRLCQEKLSGEKTQLFLIFIIEDTILTILYHLEFFLNFERENCMD